MFKLFTLIYDITATISFLIFYPFVALLRLHTGKDKGTRKIKLGLFNSPNLGEKVIMYHAVSVGEVLSLEKLIKKTKEAFPDYSLVLTTGTKTGQELAHKKYSDITDYITYFPFDIPFAVNNFLNRVKPSIVMIAETELWPEFVICAKKRNIPVAIINGRISDSSFPSYKLLKPFFSAVLNLYTKIYTQSDIDSERFIELGCKSENVEKMANLKFDIDKVKSDIDLKKGNSKILIAGSTHSGENEIVINAYKKLKESVQDIKFVIAPRHMERIPEIEKILSEYNLAYGYRSKNETFENNDVIILDTLGELKKCYAICNVAFIGGSFNNTGGHNPLEAAIYDVPSISGPNIKNFRDIYSILSRANASKIVSTKDELLNTLKVLLTDNSEYQTMVLGCKTIFKEQKGALDFVITKISELV